MAPESPISVPPDWWRGWFDDLYWEIYSRYCTPQRTAAEVEAVQALLDLKAGERVLDLACGYGRHAVPLARAGLEVTGFDLSEALLARARRAAAEAGVSVRWEQGDMRALPFEAQFEAALCLFNSLGYFADDRDHVRVLAGVARALVPGGRFLLEIPSRDGLLRRFRSRDWWEAEGIRVWERWAFDPWTSQIRVEVRYRLPDGREGVRSYALRLFAPHEIVVMAREAGLEPRRLFGGLDGRAWSLETPSQVWILVRPG